MLEELGHLLPHRWIAGDDELGRSSSFRRNLRSRGERYLLAVPSNTLVRDLEAEPPEQEGPGAPRKTPFARGDKWRASLPASAWTRIDGPRRQERFARGGSGDLPRASQSGWQTRRAGRVVRRHPLDGLVRRGEARLLSQQRSTGYAAVRTGPRRLLERGATYLSRRRAKARFRTPC